MLDNLSAGVGIDELSESYVSRVLEGKVSETTDLGAVYMAGQLIGFVEQHQGIG